MERFNLKKVNKAEGNEQYCVEISNGFTALEADIKRAWETVRENIKISVKENYEL
jgi:hypothetical protein